MDILKELQELDLIINNDENYNANLVQDLQNELKDLLKVDILENLSNFFKNKATYKAEDKKHLWSFKSISIVLDLNVPRNKLIDDDKFKLLGAIKITSDGISDQHYYELYIKSDSLDQMQQEISDKYPEINLHIKPIKEFNVAINVLNYINSLRKLNNFVKTNQCDINYFVVNNKKIRISAKNFTGKELMITWLTALGLNLPLEDYCENQCYSGMNKYAISYKITST